MFGLAEWLSGRSVDTRVFTGVTAGVVALPSTVWGEGIAGTVSVGFATIVGTVPGVLLLIAGVAVGGPGGIALTCGDGALLIAAWSVSNAMTEPYALAVYRLETEGAGSFGFEPGQLDGFVDLKRTGRRR